MKADVSKVADPERSFVEAKKVFGKIDIVVANIAGFFASDLSSFVNGQHLLVNGGATN